jgi:hypothetical protein
MRITATKGIMLEIILGPPAPSAPAVCCPPISNGRINVYIGNILKIYLLKLYHKSRILFKGVGGDNSNSKFEHYLSVQLQQGHGIVVFRIAALPGYGV